MKRNLIALVLQAIWIYQARASIAALVYTNFSDIKLLYTADAEKKKKKEM